MIDYLCDECEIVRSGGAPEPWEHVSICSKWKPDPASFLTIGTSSSNVTFVIGDPAKKSTFDERWAAIVQLEDEVHTAKKNDYTGGKDPLANYRAAAALVGLTVEMGMLMRMMEKVQRLSVLLGGTERQVMDETLTDTCIDIAVLAKLIAIAEGE